MRISYNNFADLVAASATAPSTITAYPISNLKDERLSTTFRTSTLSNLIVAVDLGSAKTITTAAILGHNFTSTATVTFSGIQTYNLIASTESILKFFDSTAYNDFITTEAEDFITTEAGDYLITGTSNTTVRYCFFEITDASNPDGYLEFARVWVGDYIDLSPSSLLDFKVIKKRSDVVMYGKDRHKFSIEGVGWRRIELSFPESENAMIEKISTMFDSVGKHSSVIFCNFDTIRDYQIVEPLYCSIVDDLTFTHSERLKMRYDLILEEDR
jgi:hypothetical protein